jgi:UPF0271 protein
MAFSGSFSSIRTSRDATPAAHMTGCPLKVWVWSPDFHAAAISSFDIKPHGVLYAMVERDEALAEAIIDAVMDVDPELIFITESEEKSKAHIIAKKKGVKVARDAMIDLQYDSQGNWIIERKKKALDPNVVAERALIVVREGKITAIDGSLIRMEAETLTIHGDSPNAPDVARTVRRRLEEEGIEVVRLREVLK